MQVSSRRLLSLTLPFLLAGAALGQTGLVKMPIADILRHREGVVELSTSGAEHGEDKRYDYAAALTLGLFDRIEIGGESDFLGGYLGNAKLLLFENPKGLRNSALSVGVTGLENRFAEPYLVARFDGKGYRLHGGAWRTEGCVRPMLGLDFPVAPGFNGSLESLGGPRGESWAAVNYAPTFLPGFEVELAFGLGHGTHPEGLKNELTFSYAFKF